MSKQKRQPGTGYYAPGVGQVLVGWQLTGECARNQCADCSGEPPTWAVALGIASGPCDHECHVPPVPDVRERNEP